MFNDTRSMRFRLRPASALTAIAFASLCIGPFAYPYPDTPEGAARKKGEVMTARADGTFEVRITPLASEVKAADSALGRMALDKTFSGGLEGTSKGEMLTAGAPTKGSAGYVAMERVEGKLDGRTGAFALQHSGTMHAGEQKLTVTVVPGSGTGQLEGLAGTMTIKVEGKKHLYQFEYTLPKQP